MSKLKHVLQAILLSLNEAQDQSNRHSALISRRYKRKSGLNDFSVPNTLIDGVDLELKFAFKSVDEATLSTEIEPELADEVFERESRKIATDAIAGVVSIFERGKEFTEGEDKWDELIRNVCSDTFVDYLSKAISDRLREESDIMPGLENSFDADAATVAMMSVLEQKLLEHPDVSFLFGRGKRARADASSLIRHSVSSGVSRIQASLSSAARPATDYEAEVIIDSERLNQLPEGAVSSLQIRARVRNYRWVIVDGRWVIVDGKVQSGDRLLSEP
jgi:hypothetical protein